MARGLLSGRGARSARRSRPSPYGMRATVGAPSGPRNDPVEVRHDLSVRWFSIRDVPCDRHVSAMLLSCARGRGIPGSRVGPTRDSGVLHLVRTRIGRTRRCREPERFLNDLVGRGRARFEIFSVGLSRAGSRTGLGGVHPAGRSARVAVSPLEPPGDGPERLLIGLGQLRSPFEIRLQNDGP
jgi:hypothetical protein